MARDVSILEAVSAGGSPPTIRIYGWSPPCLSLGRHQPIEAADVDFCRNHGIDVVRRPTGGRAVLHQHELTYSVVAHLGVGPIPRPLQDAYRTLCSALNQAARRLGVNSELTDGEVNLELPGPRSVVPCFKAPAAGEIVVCGRKLIGSSMRAHNGHILQHGAILLDWDGDLQAGAVGLEDDRGLRGFVTTFKDELGHIPSRKALEQALAGAFGDELSVALHPALLSPDEETAAEHSTAEFTVV